MSDAWLLLRLALATGVVLAPGFVVARALVVTRVSAGVAWALLLIFGAMTVTFARLGVPDPHARAGARRRPRGASVRDPPGNEGARRPRLGSRARWSARAWGSSSGASPVRSAATGSSTSRASRSSSPSTTCRSRARTSSPTAGSIPATRSRSGTASSRSSRRSAASIRPRSCSTSRASSRSSRSCSASRRAGRSFAGSRPRSRRRWQASRSWRWRRPTAARTRRSRCPATASRQLLVPAALALAIEATRRPTAGRARIGGGRVVRDRGRPPDVRALPGRAVHRVPGRAAPLGASRRRVGRACARGAHACPWPRSSRGCCR